MIEASKLTYEELEDLAARAGMTLPLEQTGLWASYQQTIEGRTPWGCVSLTRDGKLLAVVSFIDFATHGYHYLRSTHGPVWAVPPTAADEDEAVEALVKYVKKHDRKVAFIRMGVTADLPSCQPVLSITTYDATVVMDLRGTEDEMLARLKARGRRDVRKSLRESPATYADETELARASFDEYYDVMIETAARDGFSPSPQADYEDMLATLGADHCRLFAGRVDGRVVTWTIATVWDGHAVRYYGASRSDVPKRNLVTDGLIWFEACTFSGEGVVSYDMMGIGSEAFPGLSSLNTFKCKFAQGTTSVAPDRDIAVHRALYAALVRARGLLRRGPKADASEKVRQDLLPVILGGDIGTYALGRELHEAYGTVNVCVASAPIGAIAHSAIFRVHPVERLTAPNILEALRQISAQEPKKKIFLIGNTDALVAMMCEVLDQLPANVVACVPPADVVARLSDKVEFAEACRRHGLDVAQTEVVDVATADPAAPTRIPFPLVAKPARSSEYADFIAQGFQKVYYVQNQTQLTEIIASLQHAGFAGTFLVQELISGDDTYMDSITIYVDSHGKARMFGAAHVLLEDHAPSMLGNPVAMITKQVPELWEQAGKMLEDEGYRGFANFDVKRDPKTGRSVFLEVNPRIGRNSYYNLAGGVNPMRCAVEDLVDGRKLKRLVVDKTVLYTLVPVSLLRRYVRDEALLAQLNDLVAAGDVFDPQRYDADRGPRRMLDVELTERNQVRKFAKYYPEPTETSF